MIAADMNAIERIVRLQNRDLTALVQSAQFQKNFALDNYTAFKTQVS